MKNFFLLALAVAFVANVSAEGYQVNTLSAKQLGMGHTGVAQRLDSESLWFNPAAAAFQQQKFTISAGMTAIFSEASWDRLNRTYYDDVEDGYIYTAESASTDNKISTPFYLNANYMLRDNLSIGLSFNTPFGSSISWDDNWQASELIQSISLASYCAQPTVAYKTNNGKLSFGLGLMMMWGNMDLSKSLFEISEYSTAVVASVDQSLAGEVLTADEEDDDDEVYPLASANLVGSTGLALGVNVGIFYNPSDKWDLGLSYRSQMKMKINSGTTSVEYFNSAVETALLTYIMPDLSDGTFSAELPLPWTLNVGATYYPGRKWKIATDLIWTGWSVYDTLDFTYSSDTNSKLDGYVSSSEKNYKNTLTVRFGTEYIANKWLTTRVGFYYDESPARYNCVNPETPSMNKTGFTAGATFVPFKSEPNFKVDLAYGLVIPANYNRRGSISYTNSLAEYEAYQTAITADGATAESIVAAVAAVEQDIFQGYYRAVAHTLSLGVSWSF